MSLLHSYEKAEALFCVEMFQYSQIRGFSNINGLFKANFIHFIHIKVWTFYFSHSESDLFVLQIPALLHTPSVH